MADFATLKLADFSSRHPFQLTGTVLASTPWTIAIGNDALQVLVDCTTNASTEARPGDTVRITGHFAFDSEERQTHVGDIIKVIRHGTAPLPVTIRAEDLSGDSFLNRRARLSGTVASVQRDEFDPLYNWLVLRTPSDSFCAAFFSQLHPLDELRSLVDSEVEVVGIVTPFADFRMSQGAFVMVFAREDLHILHKASGDRFDVPTLSAGNYNQRQRAAGIVTASCANRFFIRSENQGCITVYPTETSFIPRPGEEVLVAGYAKGGIFGLQMADAFVKVTSATPHELPPPDADLNKIPPNSRKSDLSAREYQWRIVSVAGKVLPPDDSVTDTRRIVLDSSGMHLQIDVSGLSRPERDLLKPSATAKVSGLCLAEYESRTFSTGFYKFKGLTIIPRTSTDIRVLKGPPWWTVGKLFVLLVLLLVAFVVILIWNRMLKALSEKRGRQLYREQFERERSALKIEERTRLAIELHDSMSQTLTGVALQVESASRANAGANALVDHFLKTGNLMLASCRRELKSCLWDLHRRTFEEKDMTEAIARTVEPHSGNATVNVRFNVARKRFSESGVHTILRIIRELVSNAVRHGNASKIHIAGELHEGIIRFSVRDNGCGFDTSAIPGPAQGHFGLLGIRERLRQHRGTIRMESDIGKGSRITVTLLAKGLGENET